MPELGDSVMVEFVIDKDGLPIPSTIRLRAADFREFAQSTLTALTQSRYQPGAIGTCAVRELVQQPYVFRMRPR